MEKYPRRTQILAVIILGIILIFGLYKYYRLRIEPAQGIEMVAQQPVSQQPGSPQLLTVHVVGAVGKPGVYSLEEGKRIADAVEVAEPLDKADLSLINLAAPLQDGRQIYVPAKGEKGVKARTLSSGLRQEPGTVNINSAGVGELDRLSGIGPALAQRIIDYRETHGPFTAVEDITKVSGIGSALLEKLRNEISVD